MAVQVYFNGEFVPEQEARVSVFDHGLLYGDGVFEGIRAYNGYVFMLERHLERLYASAKAILLDIPIKLDEMRQVILETLRVNNLKDAYIRPLITRGVGDFGIDPNRCAGSPTVIVITRAWLGLYSGDLYKRGLKVMVANTRAKPPESLPPSIKSLNYLANILAKIEANVKGYDEAVMMDIRGNVAECSTENIFIARRGVLWVPPTMTNLPGVTREVVIDLARERGIEVVERFFALADLYMADECFITGTAAEVAPVVEVDGRAIGAGSPGEITALLQRDFKEATGDPKRGTLI